VPEVAHDDGCGAFAGAATTACRLIRALGDTVSDRRTSVIAIADLGAPLTRATADSPASADEQSVMKRKGVRPREKLKLFASDEEAA
jgi:hypothetical protein